MSISTVAELRTAIGNWLERSGESEVTDRDDEWIALGEAELNRELVGLRVTTVDSTALTGTVSSRNISISALDFLAPVSLILTMDNIERRLRPYFAGTMARRTQNGVPIAWTINGTNIELDAPCDQAHTFVFRYHEPLDIITDSTNFVLTRYPDAYLFKSLKHASIYFRDPPGVEYYDALARQVVDQIMRVEMKNDRATLVADPALMSNANGIRYGDFASGDF